VPWFGGEQPVTGAVVVLCKNGYVDSSYADNFLWGVGHPDQIIAYMVMP
jgi:hypothetical protein